eukprot:229447_1
MSSFQFGLKEEKTKEKSSTDYLNEMDSLYDKKYTKQLLNDLKCIKSSCKTHLIVKQLLKPEEVKQFVDIAIPLFPKEANQGLVANDNEKNTTKVTKPSPVKWINIRGRNEYKIHNEPLHLFLLFRNIYKRCKQHGIKFILSDNKNEKQLKHRCPYVFTNLYTKYKLHGLGFHQDDVDLFSVIILLTDDYGNGVLQLKDNNNNIHKLEMKAGDAVIVAKGVWHQVPVVKRNHDRISVNMFY